MKKTTIDRIILNHDHGKNTPIGKYVYNIQFHPVAGKCYIIRCKKDDAGKEWINWNGEQINGWEWLEPIS